MITTEDKRWIAEGFGADDAIIYPADKAMAQLVVHLVMDMDEQEIPYEVLKEIPSKRGDGALGSSGK